MHTIYIYVYVHIHIYIYTFMILIVQDHEVCPEMYSGICTEATSAVQLQQAALAMVQESRGHCSPATKLFAKAGSYGRYPGNIERDLMRPLQLPIEP